MDATTTEPPYACRHCGGRLSRRTPGDEDALVCPNGDTTIPVVDGIPRFPVSDDDSHETLFDRLAPIYETPVWFDPLYRFVGGPAAPRDDRATVVEMLELADSDDLEGRDSDAPTVLDIACGTGRIARAVAADADVVGIDISAGMLERAMRYAARDSVDAAFAQMSADELWFDAGAFDRATCCWALHLLPNPDTVLAEIHRVLRPDGVFVGTTLVDDYVLELLPIRAAARGMLDVEPFDESDLRRRLRAAGFSSVEFDRRGAALFFRARCE